MKANKCISFIIIKIRIKLQLKTELLHAYSFLIHNKLFIRISFIRKQENTKKTEYQIVPQNCIQLI